MEQFDAREAFTTNTSFSAGEIVVHVESVRSYMVRAKEKDYKLLDMGDADYLAPILCAIHDNSGGRLCEVSSSHQHPDLFAMLQVVHHTRLQ